MRFRNLAVFCCVGVLAACSNEGAAGNTQIDLTIGADLGAGGEAAFEADRVDYRVTCDGTAPGTLPVPPDSTGGDPDYDDSIDISGSFEIVDDQDDMTPPVWTTIMDLPPGDCTATLTVYRNGVVVCEGSEDFTVVENDTTMLNISLVCSLSVDTPDSMGDADGDFQFEIGNECPKIFDFRAIPRDIPLSDPSTAIIQTVAFDLDGTCGNNCDPQMCDDANPPNCTPGPDTGLVKTLDAIRGTFGPPPIPPNTQTTYICDPAFPGLLEICVNVSDGDLDCDKNRCISVICPDPCEGVICDDENECTADSCDPYMPGTGTEKCVFERAPDNVACRNCDGTCQAGVCDLGQPFTAAENAASMPLVGDFQQMNNSYLNPYSGALVVLASPQVFWNSSTYKGIGTDDEITGTPLGDYLFLVDSFRGFPQTFCGVERYLAGNGGDFAHFANRFVNTIPMQIQGQSATDILWANSGDDLVDGGSGQDTLDGGPGNDFVLGGNGDDHITMGYDNGVDSVFGGLGNDDMSVNALASQITIMPAADASYEFDIYYNGTWIAQITEVEAFHTQDSSIDLTACVSGVCDLCGNDILNGGEECDDGNFTDGDGCAFDCTIE